ncbi:TIGR02281 family clan AA aspartic protease [Stappia sp.]|uniref:retropepsin-like aspartic protease family protein n=1 Tax=Stappia sp. TaxID=1870903 RepID=UPI0032D94645
MTRYLIIAALVIGLAALVPRHADDLVALVAAGTDRDVAAGQTDATSGGMRTLVLKAAGNGHYEVSAHINGRPVRSLIDTGASTVALPLEVARQAGIAPRATDYTMRVNTANGVVMGAPVRLRELRLGSIRLTNVEALVLPQGALAIPLIGMSALNRLRTVDIRSGTMRLIQ